MPRCKNCKEKFISKFFLQKYCMIKDECITAFVNETKEKKQKEINTNWQKEKKQRKESLLTYSDWLKLLQAVFNKYIRERDKKEPCISCGTMKVVKYDAGHFFSVGAFPNVRFDEDNVHKQCSNNCNVHLSGNIHNYRPNLIKKIGLERFEALELRARTKPLKLSIPEVKQKIEEYKSKIKEL